MKVLYVETVGGVEVIVGQEWEGAGLFWEIKTPDGYRGPLPRYNHRSSGRFYLDVDAEKIHGATIDMVVQAARCAALDFLGVVRVRVK